MTDPPETIPPMVFDPTNRRTWPELLPVKDAAAAWGVSERKIREHGEGANAPLRIVSLGERDARVTKKSLILLMDGHPSESSVTCPTCGTVIELPATTTPPDQE